MIDAELMINNGATPEQMVQALMAENASLRSGLSASETIRRDVQAQLEQYKAENTDLCHKVDRLAQDAERYRWVMDHITTAESIVVEINPFYWDKEVDKFIAIAKEVKS